MDKHITLIANSGIQFYSTEVEFNPSQPLMLPDGQSLRYAFLEEVDFLTGKKCFELLCYHPQSSQYIPINQLVDNYGVAIPFTQTLSNGSKEEATIVKTEGNGEPVVDYSGQFVIDTPELPALLSKYNEDALSDSDTEIFRINSLYSYRVRDLRSKNNIQVPAFELLLGKWLPMPMFSDQGDDSSSFEPLGWCRVKIDYLGNGETPGKNRYRFTWAFDTQTENDPKALLNSFIFRPLFLDGVSEQHFSLSKRADLIIPFLSSSDEFNGFSTYITALLGIDPQKETTFKYKAYYTYFVNFIRLFDGATPTVTLFSESEKKIPVDLVLDVGNSRTCGVLFENGDFTRSKMLELRDLTLPHLVYENRSFDMRVVFRKADFGEDIYIPTESPLFSWKSFVRVGDEALRLVYRTAEESTRGEKTTHYSSPKRYLWDNKPYTGDWQFLVTEDDSTSNRQSTEVYIPDLSEQFSCDGRFITNEEEDDLTAPLEIKHNFSRASLMTFALIEVFQHALCQINSPRFRDKLWGNIDQKRELRNVIITCPTAMPLNEQIQLRKSAQEAFKAIVNCSIGKRVREPDIIPNVKALSITDKWAEINSRVWSYDEATCSQLVYLYAEVVARYKGEIEQFFNLKGRYRKDDTEKKSLTIGSVDIGAGTTDIMVCQYQYEGDGTPKVTPMPLFWDSFYIAGDDILRKIVQNHIIEGEELDDPNIGSIYSALLVRVLNTTVRIEGEEIPVNEWIQNIGSVQNNPVYKNMAIRISLAQTEAERLSLSKELVANLVHGFFGVDSANMNYLDRKYRVEFNTQISVPIAQKWLELLRINRPSRLYTYDELFSTNKPSDFLLNHFEYHFGFRFETLRWRFDPKQVASDIKSTIEPLMKQLSVVFYAHQCDIVLLAGRPTSLDAITELFIKYVPTSPDRLIRLNEYRVGSWFPTADPQGYFYDQKTIVAVGAMVGYLASTRVLNALKLDLSKLIQTMESTANYMGGYNPNNFRMKSCFLSPTVANTTIECSSFPYFIGCRQLNAEEYQARPIYAIYNRSKYNTLRISISRNYQESKEIIEIEDVSDDQYNTIPKNSVELIQQSITDEGGYWLDKGEFDLTIK